MTFLAWGIFLAAALMEVGGDATIRRGLRGRNPALVLAGMAILAAYGLAVNTVKWDFSRLLGVYVSFFALVSVLFGRFVLNETVPGSTWCGLLLILAGGLVIQFGRQ